MNNYIKGKIYKLSNRQDNSHEYFEWTGGAWSTPGTGFGTKPEMMSVLGWHSPILEEKKHD